MDEKKLKKQKLIKALSIIQIIFCAIALILAALSIIYIIIGYSKLNQNDVISNIANNIKLGPDAKIEGDQTIVWHNSFNTQDLFQHGLSMILCVSIINTIFLVYAMFCAIFSCVCIKNKKKHKAIFICCVIASVTSIFTINALIVVLFIVISINAYMLISRKKQTKIKTKRRLFCRKRRNNFTFDNTSFKVDLDVKDNSQKDEDLIKQNAKHAKM